MGQNDTSRPSYGASDHYDERYLAWQSVNLEAKVLFKVKKFLPYIKPTDTVLDFGCAHGALLDAIPAARKLGVEVNDAARAQAAEKPGIETYKSLADVDDSIADVVISSHTLEHIAAPYDALCQLRPKLKPGGRLVLVLPIDDWRAQRNYDPKDMNRHLYTWTPMNIGHLLDEAGFDVQEVTVLRRTMMGGFDKVAKLPEPIAEGICALYSVLRHRQELLAVATP